MCKPFTSDFIPFRLHSHSPPPHHFGLKDRRHFPKEKGKNRGTTMTGRHGRTIICFALKVAFLNYLIRWGQPWGKIAVKIFFLSLCVSALNPTPCLLPKTTSRQSLHTLREVWLLSLRTFHNRSKHDIISLRDFFSEFCESWESSLGNRLPLHRMLMQTIKVSVVFCCHLSVTIQRFKPSGWQYFK